MHYLFIILFISTSCLSDKKINVKPHIVSGVHQCAVDGMILANFSGPKAQVNFKDRPKNMSVDFYCETEEMFKVYLEPGMKARINELFVQDTGVVNWDKPVGGWIKAVDALYVVGSKRDGAMGTTFAPFSDQTKATKFINTYGGKILNFTELSEFVKSNH
jgi:copper chaperone NosL